MFSVIICSVDHKRLANVKAMYERVFQNHPWEFVHIGDAKSMAEGYNRGIAASKGDKLIFSHDDLDIFSTDVPARLERHLSNFDIVGVAGTSFLCYPTWHAAGPPYIFGQVVGPRDDGLLNVNIFGAPFPVIRDIQALDGLFIAARRSIFPKISFDEVTFDGFHHYDLDFSYAAYRAGLRLAVVNDICIYHASAGKYEESWKGYAKKFDVKWLASAPRRPPRHSRFAAVTVANRNQALEIMTPPFWRQIPENQVG